MNNILVSFIIPVYNCEKYIGKLIESILNNSSFSYEIILVNDGSTDNSKKIIDIYKKYKNIIIINKENTGVSDTRNKALEIANGRYIMFADSDDLYVNNYAKIIKEIIKKDYDLYILPAFKVEKNGKKSVIFEVNNKEININNNFGLTGYVLNNFTDLYGDCIWNKIYKKSIIKENNIRFKNNQKMAEDKLFNIEYFEFIKTLKLVNKPIYIYCYNDNSITQKYRDKFLDEYMKVGSNLKEICLKVNYKNYYYLISSFYLKSVGFIMYNELLLNNKKISINNLKRYFNNGMLKESLSNINPFKLSFKNMLKYWMIKFKLYGIIYKLLFWKKGKNEK